MNGKIIGSHGDVLFEFENGLNLEALLSSLMMRAKFGERFDDDIIANPWVNDLLESLIKAAPDYVTAGNREDFNHGAPKYFIEDGMTQNDWGFRELFHDITLYLGRSSSLLNRVGWKTMNEAARKAFLRKVIFPHKISDIRLQDMIEDIDSILRSASEAYNPDYTNDR